jgi:hypothetical protein
MAHLVAGKAVVCLKVVDFVPKNPVDSPMSCADPQGLMAIHQKRSDFQAAAVEVRDAMNGCDAP